MRGLIAEAAEAAGASSTPAITVRRDKRSGRRPDHLRNRHRRFYAIEAAPALADVRRFQRHGIDAPARNVADRLGPGTSRAHYAAFAPEADGDGAPPYDSGTDPPPRRPTITRRWCRPRRSSGHDPRLRLLELTGYWRRRRWQRADLSARPALANLLVAMGDSPERLAASMVAAGWG